jgi:hypothetical protein
MLGTVLIVFGVITGALGILEKVILSKEQKASIQNWTIRAWAWLDDAKKHAWIEWLLRYGYKAVGLVLVFVFCSIQLFAVLYLFSTDSFIRNLNIELPQIILGIAFSFVLIAIPVTIGGLIGKVCLQSLFRGSAASRRAGAIFSAAGLLGALGCVKLLYGVHGSELARRLSPPSSLTIDQAAFETMWYGMSYILLGIVILSAIGPTVLVFFAMALLYFIELILRKLAEASEGVVAAISALATGSGAILKAFA